MKFKFLNIIFLLFINVTVFSQTLDFIYADLKNCDINCRKSFKTEFMSLIDSSDSLFVFFSNDLNPFVSVKPKDVTGNIEMLLRKQFKSPLFIEDLKLISDFLNQYNFIDINDSEPEAINFHFFMESNRLVRESQVTSFINHVLISNDCISNQNLNKNISVKIYIKNFQIDPKFNLGLKHKKNELKDIGYEIISY